MKHVCLSGLKTREIAKVMMWCRDNRIPAVLVAKKRAQHPNVARFIASRKITEGEITPISMLSVFSMNRRLCIRDCDFDLVAIRFPDVRDCLL